MKHIKRHLMTLLALMLMTAAFTVSAQAAPKVPKSKTTYMYPTPWSTTKTGVTGGSIDVKGMGKSQKIKKSSVKSSNKNCIEISYVASDSISYTVKKPGTAVVSFKIGNKNYKTKVYGKKYVNPAKSVSITGVKNGSQANLAGLTNKNTGSKRLALKKTVKNPKVQVTAKKGWKITQIMYSNGDTSQNEYNIREYKKAVSKATFKDFGKSKEIKANVGCRITISFVNTKNGGTTDISYNIAVNPKSDLIH